MTFAEKPAGVLRLSHFDSPASMSILEESTRAALQPMMGVFNNLVMYDQHIAKSSLETVVPDLATRTPTHFVAKRTRFLMDQVDNRPESL